MILSFIYTYSNLQNLHSTYLFRPWSPLLRHILRLLFVLCTHTNEAHYYSSLVTIT